MPIQFENTVNRSLAHRWYSIEGAPTVEYSQWTLSPCSAKFSFVDDKFTSVEVRGCVVRKDGSLSERFMEITTYHMWNQKDWPNWLKSLCQFAISEFTYKIKPNGNKIVYSDTAKSITTHTQEEVPAT